MRHYDVGVSLLIVAIVLLMIIPIPDWALDLFQILNLSLSMVLMFSTLYIRNALEISSFPTLLLIMTLFRLALNITSTRLILLEGPKFGGKVIRTFGEFVVGGNYIVGLIIFTIIVIVQFIVITRGAERISEVAARFTLDAMPGKQMSVDADLNAGLITEEEARQRRDDIRREADFYGAMDGASKFVRGDAIASIIITFVNIIAGLVIGIVQHRLTVSQAAQVYTLLTVGDGLVSQIPALMVSTATGIIVSRAASKDNFGKEMVSELGKETKVLYLTGGVLMILGFLTPLPMTTAVVGSLFILAAWYASRGVPQGALAGAPGVEEEIPAPSGPVLSTPEEVAEVIEADTVEVEIGYGLIPLADPSQGGDLLERITMVRKQLAFEMGLVVSPIRIRDSILLKPNEYIIKIRGAEVARYELIPNRLLAINPGVVSGKIAGIPTKEPAFGLEAYWVDESLKEEAQKLGYTVVDPPTVFATHLTEILKRHAHELLGSREFELLVDGLRQKMPKLVDDLMPNVLKESEVRKVLQNLLREGISIRSLPLIFETLLEYGEGVKDVDYLTEQVRRALKRQIIGQFIADDGKVHAVAIDSDLEKQLSESITGEGEGRTIAMNPDILREFVDKMSSELEGMMKSGFSPLIVTSGTIRPYLSRLIYRFVPNVPVIAYEEIPDEVPLQVEGVVRL